MSTSSGYKHLKVTGPVEVVPQSEHRRTRPFSTQVVILIGPIGSGKSSFIQSLSHNESRDPTSPPELQIAKDQLEGATRDLTVYELHNIIPPIYVVDTPGFSDERISELGVMEMLNVLLKMRPDWRLPTYLYFHPINRARVNRTQVQGLATFQAGFRNQVGWNKKRKLGLVTTMWDQLYTPAQIMGAETRLLALQEQYWKKLKTHGSSVHKFENTQESALRILDEILHAQKQLFFVFSLLVGPSTDTQQGQLLHDSLLQRIESIRQQLMFIDGELPRCELELEQEGGLELRQETGLEQEINAVESIDNTSSTQARELESAPASGARELKDILITRRLELVESLEKYEKEISEFQRQTSRRWSVIRWVYRHILA